MSGLSEKYGARGRVGAQGESYFAQGLKRAGLTKFKVFYSLNMPDVPGRPRMLTDIDCVIANGNKIVLVDVKRWKGFILLTIPFDGRAWNLSPIYKKRARLSPVNRVLKFLTGRAWKLEPLDKSGEKLSQNMIAARERMRLRLPGADISAMVVFVPTKDHDRESLPRSVFFLVWPGLIRSFLAGDAFSKGKGLRRRLGDEPLEVPQTTLHLLTRLKRN